MGGDLLELMSGMGGDGLGLAGLGFNKLGWAELEWDGPGGRGKDGWAGWARIGRDWRGSAGMGFDRPGWAGRAIIRFGLLGLAGMG